MEKNNALEKCKIILMVIGSIDLIFRYFENEGYIILAFAAFLAVLLVEGYYIVKYLYIFGAVVGGVITFVFNFFGEAFGYLPVYDSFITFLIYEVWVIFTLYTLLFDKKIKLYFYLQKEKRKNKNILGNDEIAKRKKFKLIVLIFLVWLIGGTFLLMWLTS
ncbi:MAG: hypothetical protein ACK5LY_05440 [Lachnospirales bacterium]